jgi:hypothetical protein
MRIRPVAMNELVGGQTYIYVAVDPDGFMQIEHLRIYGKLRKFKGLWYVRYRERELLEDDFDDYLNNFFSTAVVGLEPDKRDSGHRLFRANMQNNQILEDLVRRQALVEYLELIDATEAEWKDFARRFEDDGEEEDENDPWVNLADEDEGYDDDDDGHWDPEDENPF